jgi:hypothetical protein
MARVYRLQLLLGLVSAFSGPSSSGLITVFHLEGQDTVFISTGIAWTGFTLNLIRFCDRRSVGQFVLVSDPLGDHEQILIFFV